ncbi:unnamed protein product [Leptosia nina]|uniref:Uncharacterized protein n=1 Tax=Leptosia nina TaxID=320188 RepID=A0AAV1JVW9_9NEOP
MILKKLDVLGELQYILNEELQSKNEQKPFNEPAAESQEQNSVSKDAAIANSEEQKNNDKTPKLQPDQAKPEEQKYDEQNPEDDVKEEDVEKRRYDEQNLEAGVQQDLVSKILQQTLNGPTLTEIIEIEPDSETMKILNKNKPQEQQTKTTQIPSWEDKYLPLAKYPVPKPPTFSTKISVPPLPISLSSIRSLKINWPYQIPTIFKPPRIVYLGHI